MLVGYLGTYPHMQKSLAIKIYQPSFIHFPSNWNQLVFLHRANRSDSNSQISKNNIKLLMELLVELDTS